MKLLIDSHVLLWWGQDSDELSERARSLLAKPDNEIFFSSASAWELAIKESIGKFKLTKPVEQFVTEQLGLNGFRVLPVDIRHAFAVARLPWHHRDPFDRLLVAQAQVEQIKLLTADVQMRLYNVETVW